MFWYIPSLTVLEYIFLTLGRMLRLKFDFCICRGVWGLLFFVLLVRKNKKSCKEGWERWRGDEKGKEQRIVGRSSKLTTQKGTTAIGGVLDSLWPPAGTGGFQLRLGAGIVQDTGEP